ncbi:VOC family protein [Seohaeicola zhoushanensis]|uniref:Glyoxalase n=1 Tax=Seohaeicola zhoushanensis TaxID=1569283 RepID=A0A8J3M9N2_9RHOB|nr:VOC family protein [Seohaeicola zhoushanensis]GHF67354.1 glyoxalase [Seohaeicola zhoushanensis]
MDAPWITNVKQVCVVVEDLDATIRGYWESAGIGPWAVWTPALTDMRIRGREEAFSMKLALAWTNGFMWEVVQPLEGPSIYREHLDRKGEGLHHALVQTSDAGFEATMEQCRQRGLPPLMEGTWGQTRFAYVDGEGPLKMILEVFHRAEGTVRPEADYFYPHRPDNMPL